MIRVLHCVHGMNCGGLETFLMNVYRSIDTTKVQFDFLVHTEEKCDFDDEISSLGGKIFYIPPRKLGVLKNYRALDKFFKDHKEYKVLHQHLSSLSYIEPLKIAKKNKIPVRIVHSHSTQEGGSYFHKYIHKYNQIFIKSYATHYFACSDFAGKWMYNNNIFKSDTFKIINNGIQISKFIFNNDIRSRLRANLGVTDQFVIGHVGRLSYPKNHEFLLDIFNNFIKKEPNSVLLLVGDGELKSVIEQKVNYLELKNKVILVGKKDNVSDFLQAMDIFIFPSHFEGLGIALVEAQAAGLPCLVSDKITRQVKITDNITYINLKSSLDTWTNKISDIKLNHRRKNEGGNIINAGFDIMENSKYLQDFYTNCELF